MELHYACCQSVDVWSSMAHVTWAWCAWELPSSFRAEPWAAEQQTGNLHVLPDSLAELHQTSGSSPAKEVLDWAQISVGA